MKISIPAAVLATTGHVSSLAPGSDAQEESIATLTQPLANRESETRAAVENTLFSVTPTERFSIHKKNVPIEIEWDRDAERCFHNLAVKEALAIINNEEFDELERLTRLRRRKTTPVVSGEEVLSELKQWRSTVRLLKAFQEYVATLPRPANPASRSRAQA